MVSAEDVGGSMCLRASGMKRGDIFVSSVDSSIFNQEVECLNPNTLLLGRSALQPFSHAASIVHKGHFIIFGGKTVEEEATDYVQVITKFVLVLISSYELWYY